MAEHNELGKLGEELAVDFLQQNGYTILETNWTFQKAEIDIIAQRYRRVCCQAAQRSPSYEHWFERCFEIFCKRLQRIPNQIRKHIR